MSEDQRHEGWVSLNGLAARMIAWGIGIAAAATVAFGGWVATTLHNADKTIDLLVQQQRELTHQVEGELGRMQGQINRLEDRFPWGARGLGGKE